MKFEEARLLLKEGKMIARECWLPEEGYLVFMCGMNYIWKILPLPTPNAGNYTLSMPEYDAEDWLEYPIKKCEPVVDNIEL